MLRMGGLEVHSQVKSPYPKTRKWAGSNPWKYSSGWKNVRVANAMMTRITRATCVVLHGFIDHHCRMASNTAQGCFPGKVGHLGPSPPIRPVNPSYIVFL